jgi:hypothetical protein
MLVPLRLYLLDRHQQCYQNIVDATLQATLFKAVHEPAPCGHVARRESHPQVGIAYAAIAGTALNLAVHLKMADN